MSMGSTELSLYSPDDTIGQSISRFGENALPSGRRFLSAVLAGGAVLSLLPANALAVDAPVRHRAVISAPAHTFDIDPEPSFTQFDAKVPVDATPLLQDSLAEPEAKHDTNWLEDIEHDVASFIGLDNIHKNTQVTDITQEILQTQKPAPKITKPAASTLADVSMSEFTTPSSGLSTEYEPPKLPGVADFVATTVERVAAVWDGNSYVTPEMKKAAEVSATHVFELPATVPATTSTTPAKVVLAKTPAISMKVAPAVKAADGTESDILFPVIADPNLITFTKDDTDHRTIIQGPHGTQVVATGAAGDELTVRNVRNYKKNRPNGTELFLQDNNDGTDWYYDGLSYDPSALKPGDIITAGDVIGTIGTAKDGNGTTPEIDIEHWPGQLGDGQILRSRPLATDYSSMPLINDMGRFDAAVTVLEHNYAKAYGIALDKVNLKPADSSDGSSLDPNSNNTGSATTTTDSNSNPLKDVFDTTKSIFTSAPMPDIPDVIPVPETPTSSTPTSTPSNPSTTGSSSSNTPIPSGKTTVGIPKSNTGSTGGSSGTTSETPTSPSTPITTPRSGINGQPGITDDGNTNTSQTGTENQTQIPANTQTSLTAIPKGLGGLLTASLTSFTTAATGENVDNTPDPQSIDPTDQGNQMQGEGNDTSANRGTKGTTNQSTDNQSPAPTTPSTPSTILPKVPSNVGLGQSKQSSKHHKDIGSQSSVSNTKTSSSSRIPSTDPGDNDNHGRELYAMQFLIDHGQTPMAAAGRVGNFDVETPHDLDPTVRQKHGLGVGIEQWSRGGRWDMEVAYANKHNLDPNAMDTELLFSLEESDGTSGDAAMQAASTPGDAAVIFERKFEMAGRPNNTLRAKYAQTIYDLYNNIT